MNPIKSSFFSSGLCRGMFFLLLLLAELSLPGQSFLRCTQCGNTIRRGKYWKINGRILCSAACRNQVLPRCAQCRNPIQPERRYLVSGNKPYCSRECLSKIMPECTVCSRRSFNGGIYAVDHSFFACPECMKLPGCFACSIPVRGGKTLQDGRKICPRCLKTAVTDLSEALRIFQQVRRILQEQFGLGTRHKITFSLVNQHTLHRLSVKSSSRQERTAAPPGTPFTEQGLFRFDGIIREYTRGGTFRKKLVRRKVTDARYSIYILDHLPRERMEYVMAHELAHDYLSAHFPGIRTPWIQEGFAEYTGYLYNRYRKRDHLNLRMEKNPDPVYGDGFRKIRSIAEKGSMEGLRQFLRSHQRINK